MPKTFDPAWADACFVVDLADRLRLAGLTDYRSIPDTIDFAFSGRACATLSVTNQNVPVIKITTDLKVFGWKFMENIYI